MNERGSVKAWALAFVVAATVGFGTLVGIGCAVGANVCLFSHDKPFTTTDGATIFAAKCAQCHGMKGEGGQGPSLVTGEAATLTYDELVSKISHGRPFNNMPAFAIGSRKLTRAQIEAVARFVSTRFRGK